MRKHISALFALILTIGVSSCGQRELALGELVPQNAAAALHVPSPRAFLQGMAEFAKQSGAAGFLGDDPLPEGVLKLLGMTDDEASGLLAALDIDRALGAYATLGESGGLGIYILVPVTGPGAILGKRMAGAGLAVDGPFGGYLVVRDAATAEFRRPRKDAALGGMLSGDDPGRAYVVLRQASLPGAALSPSWAGSAALPDAWVSLSVGADAESVYGGLTAGGLTSGGKAETGSSATDADTQSLVFSKELNALEFFGVVSVSTGAPGAYPEAEAFGQSIEAFNKLAAELRGRSYLSVRLDPRALDWPPDPDFLSLEATLSVGDTDAFRRALDGFAQSLDAALPALLGKAASDSRPRVERIPSLNAANQDAFALRDDVSEPGMLVTVDYSGGTAVVSAVPAGRGASVPVMEPGDAELLSGMDAYRILARRLPSSLSTLGHLSLAQAANALARARGLSVRFNERTPGLVFGAVRGGDSVAVEWAVGTDEISAYLLDLFPVLAAGRPPR
ncbi:MAG TPA: hypothetical protein PK625_01570 [Spirochaetales bacterium]|nr:hypothetical protein [Spirochaetales bacterium]